MLNRVILMGRLTADPELKQTPSGVSVCSFTVAVERNYSQGDKKQTDFIDAVAWRNNAEFISRYFCKGSMIALVGSLEKRMYEDKNGVKHYVTEVKVDEQYFTGNKDGGRTSSGGEPAQTAAPAEAQGFDMSEFEEVIGDNEPPF